MGVGFAKDAESRSNQNAGLRARLKDKYFKHQEYEVKRKTSLHFHKAKPEDLKRIRLKLKQQQRKKLIISLFVALIIFSVLIYFMLGLFLF